MLERHGSQALLVSLYGLDVQPYYNDWVETTWEKCTLRTWLQTSFLKTAFSERERQAILTTAVSAEEGYSGWSTEGGGSTRANGSSSKATTEMSSGIRMRCAHA